MAESQGALGVCVCGGGGGPPVEDPPMSRGLVTFKDPVEHLWINPTLPHSGSESKGRAMTTSSYSAEHSCD
jgi:hypothetical protein